MTSHAISREIALKLQEALIVEYSKPTFQEKLRLVLTDKCTIEEKKDLDRELRALREEVGARFGFEASPEGVEKSIELFTSALRNDPDIMDNCQKISRLLYPTSLDIQKIKQKYENISKQRDPEMSTKGQARPTEVRKDRLNIVEAIGRYWMVLGGGSTRGIVVQDDEDPQSMEKPVFLAIGSIIEELELIGERLYYEKIAGEGPNFGWVSIMTHGVMLLQPMSEDKVKEIQETRGHCREADQLQEALSQSTLVR